MPVYKAKAYMRDSALIGDQDYSFNFHVTTESNSDQAWELANEVAEVYQGLLNPPNVTIYRVSILNKNVVNGVQNRNVSLVGARTVTGDPLPAWNVARIQSSVLEGSRVHTWFLRMGLTEDDVTGQTLSSDVQDAISGFFTGLNTVGAFCDKDGGLFVDWLQDEFVHMRQMGWHRRVRPGFKRGWVPV